MKNEIHAERLASAVLGLRLAACSVWRVARSCIHYHNLSRFSGIIELANYHICCCRSNGTIDHNSFFAKK